MTKAPESGAISPEQTDATLATMEKGIGSSISGRCFLDSLQLALEREHAPSLADWQYLTRAQWRRMIEIMHDEREQIGQMPIEAVVMLMRKRLDLRKVQGQQVICEEHVIAVGRMLRAVFGLPK